MGGGFPAPMVGAYQPEDVVADRGGGGAAIPPPQEFRNHSAPDGRRNVQFSIKWFIGAFRPFDPSNMRKVACLAWLWPNFLILVVSLCLNGPSAWSSISVGGSRLRFFSLGLGLGFVHKLSIPFPFFLFIFISFLGRCRAVHYRPMPFGPSQTPPPLRFATSWRLDNRVRPFSQ
jgi:hypothetical protein